MSNWSIDAGSDSIDCLLKCSGAPYAEILPGPLLKDGMSFSRWDNVKPNAEYDLTTAALFGSKSESTGVRRLRRRQPSSQSVRGAVSMPNLCSKFSRLSRSPRSGSRAQSYMSGRLDENFSYVYAEGLSDRCRAALEAAQHKMEAPSCDACAVQQQRKSLSTCNLTLDPTILSTYPPHELTESRYYYGELSNYFSMKFRQETVEEQLLMEKGYPVSHNSSVIPSLKVRGNRKGLYESKPKVRGQKEPKSDVSIMVDDKSQNLQPRYTASIDRVQNRRLPRHKPKSWFPSMAASLTQDHQQLTCRSRVDLISNSSNLTHLSQVQNSTKTSNDFASAAPRNIVNVNNMQSGHHHLHRVGPGRDQSSSKQATNKFVNFPRISQQKNGKSKLEETKLKWLSKRTVAYFNEEGITLHAKTPSDMLSSESHQPQLRPTGQQGSTVIPYFMAVNSFEQEEAVTAKRFRCE